MNYRLLFASLVSLASFDLSEAVGPQAFGQQPVAANLRRQSFDADPNWDAVNNRIEPEKKLIVTQDFGYSETNIAGGDEGEIGGRVQRSTRPAYYAAEIKPLSLDDKLSASGTFAVAGSQGGAGVFFGFFNSNQPGGSGRPIGSLGLDFDFEGSGGRLAVRMITGTNKTAGTFITPYLPGKFRPTPIRNDGTRYRWTLDYDPHAAAERGQFKFTMTSDTHTAQDYSPLTAANVAEANIRFPNTRAFTVDLPAGYKKEGAKFDRFGLLNMMKSGGTATIFFDDVTINGAAENFTRDPKWIADGNRATYEDKEQTGAHDYGYQHQFKTRSGRVGGSFWRSGARGYYADRVGPLDLTQKLEARGKVRMDTAGPDSDMFVGWFNSATLKTGRIEDRNFVGIHVGGPTRIGHYFIPQLATSTGAIGKVEQGPVIVPGKAYEWSLVYDPAGSGGHGAMTVTLGDESVTLEMKPGVKEHGAALDRFGLFTTDTGGQMMKLYMDDLIYVGGK